MKIGVELTFLPVPKSPLAWPEWHDKGAADKVTAAFNARLAADRTGIAIKNPHVFTAKTDPFRVDWDGRDQKESWCIEVNGQPFSPEQPRYAGSPARVALESVYATAAALGLAPFVSRTKRDGTIIEYPTGGGHLHASIDLFPNGHDYFIHMYSWERAVCLDFANFPFIRWLFAQWSDDHNSRLPLSHSLRRVLATMIGRHKLTKAQVSRFVHDQTISCGSIQQRFASYAKPHYPTYEFRFFDMARSVDELVLQVGFLDSWLGHHVRRIDRGEHRGVPDHKWAPYTLTAAYRRRLFGSESFARSECERFFERLELDFEPYVEPFFQRNLITRQRWGKAL